jgi:hypothetical protein
MKRRDHERLTMLVGNAEMRDQRLVENRVDDAAVKAAPLAPAPQAHAIGRGRGRITPSEWRISHYGPGSL